MIRIEGLEKAYPNVTPLRDVNVTINDGDVISIIGPSGTGKSTLLRCINLLEKPTKGHIWIGEDEITSPRTDLNMVRRKVGMVFQSFNLFNHLSVIENVMLSPVKLLKMDRQEAYDNAFSLLKEVGLSEKADSYPDELSGGQKQRIAIVRTLAMNPDVILTKMELLMRYLVILREIRRYNLLRESSYSIFISTKTVSMGMYLVIFQCIVLKIRYLSPCIFI